MKPDRPRTAPIATTTSWPRTVGRWMVSFLGFPIGGYAAFLLVGPVDSLIPSLVVACSPARCSAPCRRGRSAAPAPRRVGGSSRPRSA